MNTNSDNILVKRFLDALTPKTKEDKIQFEAEKIHLDLVFLVKEMMEQQGINRKQLAEKLGISPSYLTQLFTGDKLFNLKTIAKLQEVFDVKFKIVPAREVKSYRSIYSQYRIDLSKLSTAEKRTIAA